ncbi:MAG: PEP-CTERM sorting domain-containing protein [Pirellulales bacterium]|nr:PEP-CTERM sorting domain-containing protein [Pirellulales bacterium]
MRKSTSILMTCLLLLGVVGSARGELVAYYSFDDGTATDVTGGHDGVITNATASSDAPTVGGTGSLDFNGSAYVDVTKTGWWNDTTFADGFTVSFWVKSTSTAYCVPFASHSANLIDVGLFQPKRYGWFAGDGTTNGSTTYGWQAELLGKPMNGLNDGQWHQYAFTYDRATQTVGSYVDGALVEGGVAGNANAGISFAETGSSGSVFCIGADPRGHGSRTVGKIDEVAIFNKGLSAAQVNVMYTDGVTAVPEPSTIALILCGLAMLAWRRWR